MIDRINQTYLVPPGQPLPSQLFYGSSFTVLASVNDVSIIIHDTIPVAGPDGVSETTEVRRPVALIKVSPQSMKDFSKVLANAVEQYEQAYSPIITNSSTD